MTAERLLNVRCQGSDQPHHRCKTVWGEGEEKKGGKKEKKEKELKSNKEKAVHGEAFKQAFCPIPEGQLVTGLVQAVWSLPASLSALR